MALYESVIILRNDTSVQDVHNLTESFIKIIEDSGAELVKKEYWGLRQLAYPIKKNKSGHYVMFGIKAENSKVLENLEKNYKFVESVIRFLTIKVPHIDKGHSIMVHGPKEVEV